MFTAFGMPAPFLPPSALPLSHTALPPASRPPRHYISASLIDELEDQLKHHQALVRDYHKDVPITSTTTTAQHSYTAGSSGRGQAGQQARGGVEGAGYDSGSGTDEEVEEEEEEADDDESAVEEAVVAAGQRGRGAMSVRAAFDVYEDEVDEQQQAEEEEEQAELDDEAGDEELLEELHEEELQYDEEEVEAGDARGDSHADAAGQLDEELAYALQLQLDAEEAAVYAQQAEDESQLGEDEEAMLVEAVRRAEEEEEQQSRRTPRR